MGEQIKRLIPPWEQAYINFIKFTSNLLSLSRLIHRDVDLYIKDVELFMLFIQTHNSEKGVKIFSFGT